MPSEVEHLRRELRDVRYVTEAILMKLVGKNNALMWELEARVQSSLRRERGGTPLREIGINGEVHDRLSSQSWNGEDIQTVEGLVCRWPRHEVAAMEGIGRKTLEKIDAVVAEKSLFRAAWEGRRG